ncbi:tyrosine-protein phosphatase non-receptor type substrate 1-like isoform X2 [Rhineura floridana]|nr:tyrosine-protein phosphatase non-receptor type substrate 1-like isoform X2 [Rhineura floridana]XP_061486897.1 tyrosine-protein phosphatase non-receptor type substrate 1-like isoform X2 [Rhineura floridana]XP_061486898.1 tyrosine-protein phosphatase non-receptor type substrate 1-like isoform X2 [Rhineura floridana]
MIMEAPKVYSRGLLTWLLALQLVCTWSGAQGQDLQVVQPPGPLSVSAGETLTLNCDLIGRSPPGGVRWHKGSDRKQPPIYSDLEAYSSRATRIYNVSQTDFSIRLSNIRPEDAGTYYCVKYRAGSPETEYRSGAGTEVSVIATPSQPSISGPTSRVESGTSATFNCTSDRFSPREIRVTWLKGMSWIKAPKPIVLPEGESISYQVRSTAEVPLTKDDVKSQLICQIDHETLQSPLQEVFRLGEILRVPPRVQLETKPLNPIQLNVSVTISCSAEGFYPNDIGLVLFGNNNNKSEIGTAESVTENRDGTFTRRSSLEVEATEERNHSVFICQVKHNSLATINATTMLIIRATAGESGSFGQKPEDKRIIIIIAVVCSLLVILVVAVIYLIRARHNKGKDPTSVRLHESEKTSGGTNQDPDPNNVTYADLNFDKTPKKSPHQGVEPSPQSEYASIQTAQPAANNENVTYADLDMVHLSKAPKRPAPRPEEASSEYASVQVQGK